MVERFWSEDYTVGYYTEVVDNEKILEDVPNPQKNLTGGSANIGLTFSGKATRTFNPMSKNLTIDELVDLLNKLYEENRRFELVLQESIRTERTDLGRNVLKQLAVNLGVEYEIL